MSYAAALAMCTLLGLPIAVLSAAIGQGKVGAAAMEGIARQPEAAGRIQTAMIIALALIEALVIYALVMFLMTSTKLPGLTVDQAIASDAARSGAAVSTK
jgi:F-type H+-transporting ATPase subunit c